MKRMEIGLISVLAAVSAWAVTPNEFKNGSDSDRIEAAIRKACETGERSIEIPRLNAGRKEAVWLIDRAILLPDDFTLVLNDCLVRLSPGAKDNIIRNVGAMPGKIATNRNITVRGMGRAVLSGGLKAHFDPPGDKGGWRTIGILFCAVRGFTIDNLTLQETQAWGVSVENGCVDGRIANLQFDDSNLIPNQDGVNIRKGCHNILVENISGRAGDDMVALTGLRKGNNIQIGGYGETPDDDIYNVIVQNVRGTSVGGHGIIRLLNQDGIRMHDIIVRNIIDTADPQDKPVQAVIRVGDTNYWLKRRSAMGEMRNILIDGVFAKSRAVWIRGPLQDSVIQNIFVSNKDSKKVDSSDAMERVSIESDNGK